MKAQILCRARPGVTLAFKVEGPESVIGRAPKLGVSVPLEGVSRRHARITSDGQSYWLEDLKSTNGTFLNGQPVTRERLAHLDVITLGKKVDLLFVLRSDEAATVKVRGIVAASLLREEPDAQPIEIPQGELTIGRSSVCNVEAESGAVSKVHARIERTADQLVIQDLGSANGTFVNGARVMTAILRDGDVISLAGVEGYRVRVEMGEITSASGAMKAFQRTAVTGQRERPRFSAEWKTRFEWSPAELEELADLQQQVQERQKLKEGARGATKPVPAKAEKAAAKPGGIVPVKSTAAVPPKPPAAPQLKPAAAAPPKPAAAEPPELGTAGPKPATAAAKAAPSSSPMVIAPPSPTKQEPPTKPSAPVIQASPAPTPRPVAAPPAADSVPRAAGTGPIAEVRLDGPGGLQLSVTETGAHQIGRAKDVPLRVNDQTVSRRHARIILSDDRTMIYLQDTGGANGTRINGVVIPGIQPLADGDRIGLGTVELTVSLRRG